MKRVIAALLTGIMVFSLCACGNQEGKKEKIKLEVTPGTPTFADNKHMEIGAYSGPRKITREAFQDYIDCGFTYLFAQVDGLYDYSTATGQSVTDFYQSDLYPYMELAEEMKIPVVVMANQLTNMTDSADYRLSEDQKAFLAEMIADLSMYRMFKGVSFKDEPAIDKAKTFGEVKSYMDSLRSNLFYYTSCLPIYVSDWSMLTASNTKDKEAAYSEYVSAFSDATGSFAYDSYPLYEDPTRGTTYIESTWFQNLRLVAEDAKEKGYAPSITIQSTAFGPPGQEAVSVHHRRITTKADVTFQLYSAMAYGFQGFSYFTYWQHRPTAEEIDFYSAMIDEPGDESPQPTKTDTYYVVKEANAEIKKFDHVYLNFDWEGTMALTTKGEKLSTVIQMAGDYKSPRIAKAEATGDAIIGCLKDADGYDGFMIVNATDPGQDTSNSVSVIFKKASKALAYINGEEQTIELKDGAYTFELNSGDGVFVIPIQ